MGVGDEVVTHKALQVALLHCDATRRLPPLRLLLASLCLQHAPPR